MKTQTLPKALSLLLIAVLVFNTGGNPVFAEDVPFDMWGLTDCHTVHGDDCGYTVGTEEKPCTFISDEDAMTEPDEDEVATPGNAAGHTRIDAAVHIHDDTCGYAPAIPSAPCTHSCEDCAPYTEPKPGEAVKALITMVETLPNAADLTKDNIENTIPAFEAAVMAYEALSSEDKAVFDTTKQYTKLMELRDALYGMNTLELTDHSVGDADAFRQAITDTADGGTVKLTGTINLAATGVTITGKAITIDLNGQELVLDTTLEVMTDGRLALSDNTGGGEISIGSGGSFTNNGQLTITGGTVTSAGITITNNDGIITVGGEAKLFGESGVIANTATGTVTVEGNAALTATNTLEYCTAIANQEDGTVNIKDGTVKNLAGGSVIHNSGIGTIQVSGGEIISPGFDGGMPACAINNTGTGRINVTGGTLTANGNGNGYAIRNDATDAGGNTQPAGTVSITGGELVATGNKSCSVYNKEGTLSVNGNTMIQATGDEGRGIVNLGTLSIGENATVSATQPDGVAVLNYAGLDIFGGNVGRVALDSSFGSPATYVYGQSTPPTEPTGIPLIIGEATFRIKVTLPSAADIAAMAASVTDPDAVLPDPGDPLAFFELTCQTYSGGTWNTAPLPDGTKLVLPFPAGRDSESNNYQIYHFKNGAAAAPEILEAAANPSGIVCEATSFSPFMPVMFPRYQVSFDANGGKVSPTHAFTNTKNLLAALPTPRRDGYDFLGWFTAAVDGTKVTSDYVYTADTTIFAQWTKATSTDGKLAAGTHYLFPDVPYTTTLSSGWYINGGLDGTNYMQDMTFYVSQEGNYVISAN